MLALTLMTASNPVFLMRECLRSSSNRSPSLVVCERRREEGGRKSRGRKKGGREGKREIEINQIAHKENNSEHKEFDRKI